MEHGLLNPSPQHATAHKPGIDRPNVRLGSAAYDGAYDAVIAKLVDKSRMQGHRSGICFKLLHLGFGIPARGQVELIALVNKLRNARSCLSVKGTKDNSHFQRAQV